MPEESACTAAIPRLPPLGVMAPLGSRGPVLSFSLQTEPAQTRSIFALHP